MSAYTVSRARARERAKQDPTLIPHGTPSGYSYWGCRCVECTLRTRQRRAQQRAAAKAGAR